MLGDLLVHDGLREGRLIPLVVPITPIAYEIDEKVAAKLRAVSEGEPRHLDAGLRVVCVHVHDGYLETARESARIRRAVRILGSGREPELIVHDDVNGAAGAVAREPAQIQRLGDDALTRKRRVTVYENRQADRGIERRRAASLHGCSRGPSHPLDDRIDRLEVARIRRHRDDEIQPLAALHRPVRAGVVFDVASPRHVFAERS